MPTVKKVLNSSIVLIDGEGDKDSIVMAKGIGYGKKPGEIVELQDDSRFFIPVSNMEGKQLLELLDAIPAVYLEVAKDIIQYAENQLKIKLNEHIYIALTDHLHFAVKRAQERVLVTNKVFWELKTYYPNEYEVGCYGLTRIKEMLDIELPQEEAANIAFHIVNAQKDVEHNYDAMRAAAMIGHIMTLVTYYLKTEMDRNSIHYSRFVSHLQYFTERFLTNDMLDSENDFLFHQMSKEYPQDMECAEKIRTFLVKEYKKSITNEEVAYLAVHIHRLNSR